MVEAQVVETGYYIQRKLEVDGLWHNEYDMRWEGTYRNNIFTSLKAVLRALAGLVEKDNELGREREYRVMARVTTDFEVK